MITGMRNRNPINPIIEEELTRLGYVSKHENARVTMRGGTPTWKKDFAITSSIIQALQDAIPLILAKNGRIGQPLTPDEMAFNVPFWTQMVFRHYFWQGRDVSTSFDVNSLVSQKRIDFSHILRLDNPDQVLYRVEKNSTVPFPSVPKPLHSPISGLDNAQIMRAFIRNFSSLSDQFRQRKNDLDDLVPKDKWITILSNHATWANLSIIAFFLEHSLGVNPERIFTLVWPSITTNEFTLAWARRFSNLIKTMPDTERGNTGYPHADKVSSRAIKQVLQIMSTSAWNHAFLLIAPSGTTDKFDSETWKINLARPSKGTLSTIERLAQRWNPQLLIWVNDLLLFPWNKSPRLWQPVHVSFSPFFRNNHIEELPNYVLDKYGKPIGSWMDTKTI